MTPILTGIVASGISGHLTPPWSPEGAFDALASVTLSSSASTITFTGIPNNYKHLQLRGINLSNGNDNNIMLRFNGVSSAAYSLHAIDGVGSTTGISGGGSANATYASAGYTADGTFPGPVICDIFDYSSSTKNKTTRALGGSTRNGGTEYIAYLSSAWYNTSPITTIEVIHGNIAGGKTFSANTQFALYGVK